VRLLHVTDTHLGVERWFRGAPTAWRRADDHLAAFRAALAPVERGEVDLVVHSGDLFDRSRPPARYVAEAASVLAAVARRVPVVLFPGNHDRRGLAHHFPAGIQGIDILDTPAVVHRAGVRIGVVPYMASGAAWGQAAQRVVRQGVDLLFAHQAFDGSRVPGLVFRHRAQAETVGEPEVPPVDLIFSGHIHTRQAFRLGRATVVHPGSSERTSFVERDEIKGITRWDHGRWWFEDLPARRMIQVSADSHLSGIREGDLVRLEGEARTREAEAEVIRRGGWVAAWPYPTGQVPLFGITSAAAGGRLRREAR
jgi:exonuclease SbcD